MNPISKVLFVFITLMGVTFCNAQSQCGDTKEFLVKTELARKIDSALKHEEQKGFSGAVVVALNDNILIKKGYGFTDSLKTFKVTPDTKFYLASTTKGITGVIALVAEQKGIISLNDSIGNFFPNADYGYKRIKIHDMLIHTAGLPDNYKTFGATKINENISLVLSKSLIEPGKFRYTSAGYWMTAAIIQKAAKMPYEEFVHKFLFGASELKNSSFWFEINDRDAKKVAQKLSDFPPTNQPVNWGFRASSGIIMNISDFYCYLYNLKNEVLLKKEALAKLLTPHIKLGSGIGVSYGWYISKTKRGTTEIWSRGGEEFGHNSALRWFKDEGLVIAILTNCGQLEGEEREANRTVSDIIEKVVFDSLTRN